ncbi:MAG TPA: hypothetical protein VFE53_00295 [Mucilaginibacter sp.]|jgi:hypothetical protein|nr:hypothetical protein [Mucilaginibacter sp.]
MDIAVLIILLFIGLPLFFFWRWVFRKTVSSAKKGVLVWTLTILSAPAIYVLVGLIWIGGIEYYPNRDFDQRAWKADSDSRYEYTHDLIKSKLLIGKTRSQVLQILGDHGDTSQTELYYYIGFRPEITGIDPSNIVVEFKNGKVDTVIENDK